jgi:hypothetical protein
MERFKADKMVAIIFANLLLAAPCPTSTKPRLRMRHRFSLEDALLV